MSDPRADGLVLEVLHAVDGKVLGLLILVLVAAGMILAPLLIPARSPEQVLADHEEAERTRAEWREANREDAPQPWGGA